MVTHQRRLSPAEVPDNQFGTKCAAGGLDELESKGLLLNRLADAPAGCGDNGGHFPSDVGKVSGILLPNELHKSPEADRVVIQNLGNRQ
jgi:hypothetical protein